eukprot:218839-Chlamydomonas_euryale.AAC.3
MPVPRLHAPAPAARSPCSVSMPCGAIAASDAALRGRLRGSVPGLGGGGARCSNMAANLPSLHTPSRLLRPRWLTDDGADAAKLLLELRPVVPLLHACSPQRTSTCTGDCSIPTGRMTELKAAPTHTSLAPLA